MLQFARECRHVVTRGERGMQEKTRLTPRRGRPREDMKQVKIPETPYKMLYVFAKRRNLTFGDAAAYLIGKGMERVGKVHKDAARGLPVFSGTRKQVKIPKAAHFLLGIFAEERGITLGDAAAFLIAEELARINKLDLDEDDATRQKRLQQEAHQRASAAMLETLRQYEASNRPNEGA